MEKNYNPEQKNAKAMKQQTQILKSKIEVPKHETKITDDKKQEIANVETKKPEERNETAKEKPVEKKLETKKIQKIKKDLAEVNARDLRISTKYAVNICRFIKFKTPERAIENLEKVLERKKPVPMRGEYPHQKGKGIAGAKYPQNATKVFINLVKSLKANSEVNGLNNPIISLAISNQASMPRGRFGKWQRKRTHVKLVAIEKSKFRNQNKKTKKENKGERK